MALPSATRQTVLKSQKKSKAEAIRKAQSELKQSAKKKKLQRQGTGRKKVHPITIR